MNNPFLKHVNTEAKIAALMNVQASPQAMALLDVMKAQLERVNGFLAARLGTNDLDWRQDSRWKLAEKEMLENLVALPQAVGKKLMAEEGAQKQS